MWNETQGIPEKKACDRVKVNMLKEEHTLFIIKLVDGFAPMTLQQMREKLLEKYVDISISKTQFYRHVKE
ncbi:uncharacterized protein BX663DRAFT_26149 [Cokeromyces recurvatus]|uniref:uncharacterized protein n=1 Tax=Cokeromyces recurvatus TaxID=90255 RepID=UPI002220247A|nr:uncharacterized protein BX663DRAFT_26149 [Cokeromyces recurvatus]KAI7908262.1 hypothetical protein BX663DRAFT_26149 [Cokeromyces recurvatus]